jgi:hypothetical protein
VAAARVTVATGVAVSVVMAGSSGRALARTMMVAGRGTAPIPPRCLEQIGRRRVGFIGVILRRRG